MTRGIALRIALVVVVFAASVHADPPDACDESRPVCLVRKYWHADDERAIDVVDCETGGRWEEDAQRPGSQYVGLWQIGTETHADRIADNGYTAKDMRDGGKNTAVAFDLFTDDGWEPWEQCL